MLQYPNGIHEINVSPYVFLVPFFRSSVGISEVSNFYNITGEMHEVSSLLQYWWNVGSL